MVSPGLTSVGEAVNEWISVPDGLDGGTAPGAGVTVIGVANGSRAIAWRWPAGTAVVGVGEM